MLCQNPNNGGMWNNINIFSRETDDIGQVNMQVRIGTCISELPGSNMGRVTNRNRQCSLYHMADVSETVCCVTPESFKPFILLPIAAGLCFLSVVFHFLHLPSEHLKYRKYRHSLADLRKSCLLEGPGPSGNWLHASSTVYIYIYIYKWVQFKYKHQHTANHWSQNDRALWPRYRPAVFFRHLVSSPFHSHKEKLRDFQKY